MEDATALASSGRAKPHGIEENAPGRGRRDRGGRSSARLLLLSALLLGVAHLFVLPPWMGEDEPWQFDYVKNVSEGHRPLLPWERDPVWHVSELVNHPAGVLWATYQLDDLSAEQARATQASVVASMRANHFSERVDHDPRHGDPDTWDEVQGSGGHFNSYNQPRAYYFLAGGLLAASGQSDVEAGLYVTRLLSLVCYLAVVALTLATARLVTSDDRVVLLAGVVAAWLPMHVRQAAVVNNDVLVKVFVAASLFFSARFAAGSGSGRSGLRDLTLAVLLLGAGLLTKTTAAGGIAALGAAILLHPSLPRRVRTVAVAAVAGLAVAAALYWGFSNNAAMPRTLERFLARFEQGRSVEKLRLLLITSIGTTNWESRWLAGWAYTLVGTILLSGIGIASLRLLRRAGWFSQRLLLLCIAVLLAQFALIVLHGEARGRYFFPPLPALASVLAVGLAGIVPDRWRGRAVLAAVAFFLVYEGAFLWGAMVVNYYLVLGA